MSKLVDLVEFNPSVRLKKGEVAPFIEMAALPTNARDIPQLGTREFSGSGSKFENGDTLFARITPCLENGKGGYVSTLRPSTAGHGSTEFIVMRARSSSDSLFVYYLTREPEFRRFAEKQMSGTSGRQRVSWQSLAEYDVPEILPAQRAAIGATLGALDDKIELNRKMNATLEAMARALFRDWFVDFGPTRAKTEGRAPYLSPDLWSLFPDRLDAERKPEGWAYEPLLDQAEWVNGAAYKNMHFSDAPDALPVIKIAELKNGVTGNTQWTATDLGARYLIDDGELLFSWSGNPDTSIDTFLWTGGKAWLNQHIFAVRSNGKRSKPYLHSLLKFLKPEFAELARNKQTTGLGHVTKADMQRMMVCTASPEVHSAFDRLIEPIFKQALGLQMETRTLSQTRDLLLPRLMSGELRVADLTPSEREAAA
ncbi:MAG: restriction endonuclease subunit S [Rhodobacteraceae bacterium]|nr:restriction endonuclease subunit S [Paracoccaceae bacterium]